MPRIVAFPIDDIPSKVVFGRQGIVRCAAQRQIRSNMLAAVRERLQMM